MRLSLSGKEIICLLSTCCDAATITQDKRNTNIQELCTLPNTLLYTLHTVKSG